MEIIKTGDVSRLKHIKEFICTDCGCVFRADDTEYRCSDMQYNTCCYECDCPTCGHTVYTEG